MRCLCNKMSLSNMMAVSIFLSVPSRLLSLLGGTGGRGPSYCYPPWRTLWWQIRSLWILAWSFLVMFLISAKADLTTSCRQRGLLWIKALLWPLGGPTSLWRFRKAYFNTWKQKQTDQGSWIQHRLLSSEWGWGHVRDIKEDSWVLKTLANYNCV